jgi:hypothetical protein
VAAVIKRETKAEDAGDLVGEESDRFRCVGAVGGDDLLDMRRFLKDFNGDFADLFRSRES